jgi:dihydroceramidase
VVNGHDRVFLVAFSTYLFIGIGSICFHTTLKYPMQLLDELSMIYTSCTTFFAVFSFGRPQTVRYVVGAFSVLLAVFITLYYHYLKDPAFHQNAFALLTSVVVFTSMYNMDQLLRPGSARRKEAPAHAKGRKPSAVELQRRDTRDANILKQMWFMVGCGLGSVGLGFFLWNLDNIYCETLRGWRRELGLPWGILLEGHGWWLVF